MDSLTQFTLGAAVGFALAGPAEGAPRLGRRALLWGGLLGTLPDLDVLVPMGSAVADFTYHRSWSHSLFVLAAITPLLVWLIRRLHGAPAIGRGRAALMVYAVLGTHVLLDSLTVYGTQIFWPLVSTPVAVSSLFIVDPAYTVPLLIGICTVLVRPRRAGVNTAMIALSCAYIAWSLGAKVWLDSQVAAALDQQGLAHDRLMSTPAPLNTLLWRMVAMKPDGSGYHVAYRSVFDGGAPVRFNTYDSQPELLAGLEAHWPVQRLRWFTHGYFTVGQEGGDIIMRDLRMGIEGRYVFNFKVGERRGLSSVATDDSLRPGLRSGDGLEVIFARITDPAVDLPPPCQTC